MRFMRIHFFATRLALYLPVVVCLFFGGLSPVYAGRIGCPAIADFPNCNDPDAGQYCQPCNGTCIYETDICILEPLPGGTDMITPAEASNPLGAFLTYINVGGADGANLWTWAFRVGVAIAVLNGVIGGLQIAISNGDSGKIEEGKSRIIWSIAGLLLLLLSGVFLEFINPFGFENI